LLASSDIVFQRQNDWVEILFKVKLV
jgi:hypothetical protein